VIFLEIFMFKFFSGICHLAAPSTISDKQILWKTNCCWSHMLKFQRPQDLDELFLQPMQSLPSHPTSDLHQLEVQWWILSFILQTSWLEDFNMRIMSFKLCKLKQLKVFSLWYPASRARSQSCTNSYFFGF